jgi:hypothetical protein
MKIDVLYRPQIYIYRWKERDQYFGQISIAERERDGERRVAEQRELSIFSSSP